MNKSFLQKLTILIPSYNRSKYLKRTIKYWSNYNVNLIILDGSDSRLEDPCLNSKSIKYIHNKKGYYDRLLSSIDHIETEFMILSCDDEFYLPSALSRCIEFLTKHADFSSCGGRAVGFRTDKNKIFFSKQYTKSRDFKLNHENPEERIINHFSNYVPAHTYSVMKSSKWKKICKHVFEKEYNFFASMELQTEYLAMVSGKSKIIPELLWMRNKEVPKIEGTNSSMSRSITINQWWYDKRYKKEKDDFLYRMKKACNDLSVDQIFVFTEDKIAELFEIYIKNPKYKETILSKIKMKIPHKIKKYIRQVLLIKEIFIKDKYINSIDEINLLEEQSVLVNRNDLDKIISTIKY